MIHVSDRLWLVISSAAAQVLRVATSMVLARLITRDEFGLFGVVTAAIGLFVSFGDLGARRFLVQTHGVDEFALRDTVFVVVLGVSVLYAVLTVATGAWLAYWRGDDRIVGLAALLAAGNFLAGVYDFQLSGLSRDLQFGRESWQNLALAVVLAASGVGLAVAGFGVYTLALQPLLAQVAASALIWRHRPLHWPARFAPGLVPRFFRFGWKLALSQYANLVAVPVQTLFVSRGFGDVGVGVFGRAAQVRDLIGVNVLMAFDRVLFPLFARHQNEPDRLRELYLRGTTAVTVLATLGTWGLVITAPDLVRAFLGPQWADVPPVLRALAVPILLAYGPGIPAYSLCMGIGRPHWWVWYTMTVLALFLVAGVVAGATNLTALSVAFAAAQVPPLLVLTAWAVHSLAIPWREYLGRVLPVMACGAASAGVVWFALDNWMTEAPRLARLAFGGVTFPALYAAATYALDRRTLDDFGRVVRWKTRPAAVTESPG